MFHIRGGRPNEEPPVRVDATRASAEKSRVFFVSPSLGRGGTMPITLMGGSDSGEPVAIFEAEHKA